MANKKAKYRLGQKVYSYQNPSTPAKINRIRLAEKGTQYDNAYRLSLPSGNSKWIGEGSLSLRKK